MFILRSTKKLIIFLLKIVNYLNNKIVKKPIYDEQSVRQTLAFEARK